MRGNAPPLGGAVFHLDMAGSQEQTHSVSHKDFCPPLPVLAPLSRTQGAKSATGTFSPDLSSYSLY